MKVDGSIGLELDKVAERTREAEAAGYSGVWTAETAHDPFMPLLLAAEHSSDLELGTSIAVAFARSPMTLANTAWDLQAYSQGRFILGLGSQIKPHITKRFSMPWSHPAARMREFVLAMRAIWNTWLTGEKLEFRGDFYTHTLMTPFFTPDAADLGDFGPPRVFLAGVGPLMTEVAAEVGDGYFLHPFHSAESFDLLSKPALERGLERAGRKRGDLAVSAQVIVATGADEQAYDTALFSARSQIGFYASTPAYRPVLEVHGWQDLQPELMAMSKAGKWVEMAGLIDDEMLNTFAVTGSVAEVAQKLASRCRGKVNRVSPIIYQQDTALLEGLLTAVRAAFQEE